MNFRAFLFAALALAACGGDDAPVLPDASACPADTPAAAPSPMSIRDDFTGVFDDLTQSLYFFGGETGQPLSCATSIAPVGDLWRYSIRCRRWIEVTATPAPSARTGATATHEIPTTPPDRWRMILFGGRDAQGMLQNDVWAFDMMTQTWSQIQIMGTTAPEPREFAKIVFNASFDQVWLFGGNAGPDPAHPDLRNDVWMLDLKMDKNTWTQLPVTSTAKPSARMRHSATFDYLVQTLYVGFGIDGPGLLGADYRRDLYAYQYDSMMMKGTWTVIPIMASGPTGRINAGLEFDDGALSGSGTRRMLLFGGRDNTLGPTNDLWVFNLGTRQWSIESPGDMMHNDMGTYCARPADFVTPRQGTPERRSGMLFQFGFPGFPYVAGGQSDCGDLNDVWVLLEGNGWLRLADPTAGESCARSGAAGCTMLCQ